MGVRLAFLPALALAAAVALGGCGGPSASESAAPPRELTVLAASSLTEAFGEIGAAFERTRPGVRVVFQFGGSQQLRMQIEQGIRADVFASADPRQMELARNAGAIAGEPRDFATNRLAVVVPRGDGAPAIRSLADLARPGLKIVLANPDVPAGAYAREILAKASALPEYGEDFAALVLANVVSEEPNVRQALAKVRLDEADAGIVYETDATGEADAVRSIPVPDSLNVLARYPVAPLAGAREPGLAAEFALFLVGEESRTILARRGFSGGGS